MVEKAAQDYSKILQSVSLDKEINPICMSIEDMLTRLDELESLLVNVKGENNVIMDQYTNSILAFTPQFEVLKQRIDQLEHFVEVVNNNVDEVEKSIDIAEAELNVTDYSLKGLLFKPLLAKAKSVSESNAQSPVEDPVIATNLKDGQFQAVPIFNTSDYFNSDISS
ncbi:biogenesis of lysosome-related organelles complex 1 subunit 4 [Lucilia sericata]|uniref:biogenesis of lysosome-related organelles complex 1 subunit 4 n=1 Tax=Lucilia sericata TaxID=13632 RepID=UPI0018A853EF|nr:biogenesis of lysosome-related organelles complex 1 subunit 4 [Lucilia sericata]